MKIWLIGLCMCWMLTIGCKGSDTPDPVQEVEAVQVAKTNPMKIYMHYMPWFQGREVSGYWGIHWKMANRNPDMVDDGGKRQIAAHYYPLIGPYDSKDQDVIEYHLLLMKYAGVDGILIDWYGSHNALDYRVNLDNANALISRLDTVGLGFGVVYEEFTAENAAQRRGITPVAAAQQDMKYLEDEYYVNSNYLRIGEKPLLLTFGPRYFKSGTQWQEIFAMTTVEVEFLSLWGHRYMLGATGKGEFSWIDFDHSLKDLKNFCGTGHSGVRIPSAYPGFRDFYEQGGWGQSYGEVSYLNGETLRNTLKVAQDFEMDMVQLATWNDFGEGTMIEPTLEFGFQFLEILQEFTGVSYSRAELELIHRYYLLKKEHKGDAAATATLAQVYKHLAFLEVDKASTLLDAL